MKAIPTITRKTLCSRGISPRPSLMPRKRYPTVSIIPLGRSPLAKLAWIFGFGR